MLAACSGVKSGASSISTWPPGSFMSSRLAGSGVRHSCAFDCASSSFVVGVGLAWSASAGRANRLASVMARSVRRMRRSLLAWMKPEAYSVRPVVRTMSERHPRGGTVCPAFVCFSLACILTAGERLGDHRLTSAVLFLRSNRVPTLSRLQDNQGFLSLGATMRLRILAAAILACGLVQPALAGDRSEE